MLKALRRGPGDWLGTIDDTFTNRTGATMVKGQVAMVDLLDTQAEVTNQNEGDPLSCFANLTPCTQAAVELGFPVVVCLSDSVADNANGLYRLWGKCDVAVCDDDVSTTDIDKGDSVSILVSESAVAVQAFATGAAAGNRILGLALEDAAASSSDTDDMIDASTHRRSVLWTGGIPVLGAGDT